MDLMVGIKVVGICVLGENVGDRVGATVGVIVGATYNAYITVRQEVFLMK